MRGGGANKWRIPTLIIGGDPSRPTAWHARGLVDATAGDPIQQTCLTAVLLRRCLVEGFFALRKVNDGMSEASHSVVCGKSPTLDVYMRQVAAAVVAATTRMTTINV